jgi:hypothetical protein
MFNSAILDVVVGVVFFFVLVSTLCSAIREGIEAWIKTRASYLEHALREIFRDEDGVGLTKSFFDHPLIYALFLGQYEPRPGRERRVWNFGSRLPSYIPAQSFSRAILDIAARGPSTDAASGHPDFARPTLDSIRASVENLQNPSVQRVLLGAIDSARGDIEEVRSELEAWYDAAMERVSGWYKRTTQWILFVVALCVVVALNLNTLTLIDHLYRDQVLRSTVVAAAEGSPRELSYLQASQELDGLHLPIGWVDGLVPLGWIANVEVEIWRDALQPFLGLLITALAATLGAPFWFDVLNKVTALRAAIKPSSKSASGTTNDVGEAKTSAGSRSSSAGTETTGSVAMRKEVEAPSGEPDVDACDHPILESTPDEELPEARGGVASATDRSDLR